MPDPSEFKILRDEMAKIIADSKKKDRICSELELIISKQGLEISELQLVNSELQKRLTYYENPHSPPSQNSIPSQQRKTRNKTKSDTNDIPKKSGQKPGHKGDSHNRKSSETIHNRPKRCSRCGSANINDFKLTTKQITDIPFIPKCKTVTYVNHYCVCTNCNGVTKPESIGIHGTSLGPKMLCFAINLWNNGLSLDSIRDMLDMFDARMCKTTVYPGS